MSDLTTAAIIFGSLFLLIILCCVVAIVANELEERRDRRRRQALDNERQLLELEQAPLWRIDPIIDGLPADIRKDFQ